MAFNYLTLAGFLLAAITTVIAAIQFKKLSKLKSITSENQARLKKGHKAYQDLDHSHAKSIEALQNTKKEYDELISKQSEYQHHSEQSKKEIETLTTSLDEKNNEARLKIEHLSEENEVLKAQLSEAVKEKQTLFKQIKSMEKSAVDKSKIDEKDKEVRSYKKSLDEVIGKYKKLKSINEKLKGILRKVDPKEAKKFKQKSKSYEQLYTSMKSLRELAEERNENWETALKKLSLYVLSSKGQSQFNDKSPIGEVVGLALETIGTRLVEDDQEDRPLTSSLTESAINDPQVSASQNKGTDPSNSKNLEKSL